MDSGLKKILRAVSLELRHVLEGRYDDQGRWLAGDLERRLNELGVWRDRPAKPLAELSHLSAEDKAARHIVDAYLRLREEAGVARDEAVAEFVREAAYTWANRLFALRCMEVRGIIDEVILQKETYGGRSLVHSRFARRNPEACAGEDDGLFAVLFAEFSERAKDLPVLFNSHSPAIALRPSVTALKKCIALLSGREAVRGQEPASDAVFEAPDAFGWAYQYWNAEEKDRVFEMVRTKKGAKIEGADIIPTTCIYTEPYMVKFLVQNSLGALWMGMHPASKLSEGWEYYVKDADRAPVEKKSVAALTFLDPACGSGHFLLEAFDLLYSMYEEESVLKEPSEICAAILNNNLFGIDIDERAVQIAEAALWMKAKEKAPDLDAATLDSFRDHLVATNICLPKGKDHLQAFLQKHPEDQPLRSALEAVFQGLENAPELGSLLQIEEPVEKELRYLKAKSEENKGKLEQQALFGEMAQPKQGELPLGVESYEQWKARTLARLRAHFSAEAEAADPVQAFFGQSAEKGLVLFDLLSRRYDTVAANPPYMGSSNMGPLVRKYVERQYTPGKRDLYAAFILRCRELARANGYVSMVTQQSWMFLRSFADMRALPEEKIQETKGRFTGLLRETVITTLAHLGPGAFAEISGEVVNTALFTFCNMLPLPEHRMVAFRVIGPKEPEGKDTLLRQALTSQVIGISSDCRQVDLLPIPETPLVYWLRPRFFELLKGKMLRDVADVVEGLHAGHSERVVRHSWESIGLEGWVPYAKGGGYGRWAGQELWMVDWRNKGRAIRERPGAVVPSEERYFSEGWTYSYMARGSIGVRRLAPDTIFSNLAFAVLPMSEVGPIGTVLNCRLASFVVRSTNAKIGLQKGYVERIPMPRCIDDSFSTLESVCIALKNQLIAQNLTERAFRLTSVRGETCLRAWSVTEASVSERIAAALHSVEGLNEQGVFTAYNIAGDDLQSVLEETGTPTGWYRLIADYDALPDLPSGLLLFPQKMHDHFAALDRILLSSEKLVSIKDRLRALYAAGPGAKLDDQEENSENGDEGIEEDEIGEAAIGAHISIPAETFLEELSQKLEIHPVSVYWLLEELRSEEGLVCFPELKHHTEDYFSVKILRLLGHRWPKQSEAGEQLPDWADRDGIIPITEGSGEKILLERVRERIADEFPGGNVASIEREFGEIIGTTLEKWLAGPFFKRHISQFKKRPIAWQIELGTRAQALRTRGKKRATGYSSGPVFSCLVYYHKLDADLLPKIRTQYIGPLKSGYETELRALERVENPTTDQSARKIQLTNWIDELKVLDEKLSEVIVSGFGPESLLSQLRQFAIDDAMLSLKARWLRKLVGVVRTGPLKRWEQAAAETYLHPEFPEWIHDALMHLDYHCSAVGPKTPEEKTLSEDPDSTSLAALICPEATDMVSGALMRACQKWWKRFDEAVIAPVRQQVAELNEQIKLRKEERELVDLQTNPYRRADLEREIEALKDQVSALKNKQAQKVAVGQHVRAQIEDWTCPEAEEWEPWLAAQPLYDHVSSLDERRSPPRTVAEFIAQESAYAPDINDGVRVNIAPLQRAGLLPAEVIAKKDVDKAIVDRAEWRADERRWCREGKLPHPGWWKKQQEEAPLTLEVAT
ncbi:MAG: BREX-1 system adenine-specific DNA-methyltransferase PglX [Candidatus Binatia bacterium]